MFAGVPPVQAADVFFVVLFSCRCLAVPLDGHCLGQLYGMKWARLMFGREFRVEHVMLLWDHIFASSWLGGRPDLPECIEVVAVAMVRAFSLGSG